MRRFGDDGPAQRALCVRGDRVHRVVALRAPFAWLNKTSRRLHSDGRCFLLLTGHREYDVGSLAVIGLLTLMFYVNVFMYMFMFMFMCTCLCLCFCLFYVDVDVDVGC